MGNGVGGDAMGTKLTCKGLSQDLDGHMTQGFMVAVGARMGNFTYVSWGLLR